MRFLGVNHSLYYCARVSEIPKDSSKIPTGFLLWMTLFLHLESKGCQRFFIDSFKILLSNRMRRDRGRVQPLERRRFHRGRHAVRRGPHGHRRHSRRVRLAQQHAGREGLHEGAHLPHPGRNGPLLPHHLPPHRLSGPAQLHVVPDPARLQLRPHLRRSPHQDQPDRPDPRRLQKTNPDQKVPLALPNGPGLYIRLKGIRQAVKNLHCPRRLSSRRC